MELIEKQISTKRIYDGKVVSLRVDEVLLENGNTAVREICEHKGAVCVVPMDDDGTVYMVRQFRYAFGEAMLEIPAGKLDYVDEDKEGAARRELEEEVGLRANEMIYLGAFRPSVAIFTEVIHMYLARGLEKSTQHLDEDEFLNVERYHISKVFDMIMNGEITDGKTIGAILKAGRLLNI